MAGLLLVSASFAADAPMGLTVRRDGALLREGRLYRGVGVNWFDPFCQRIEDPQDRSFEEGFAVLARHKIPFVRFMACGFWPRDMKLCQTDKAAYFALLDEVVRCAEKHGIGLIPSLFWHTSTVPDLVGEPCDAWGDPASKTHQFMRDYTREVVTRYKASPAIWGWEFGNEYNLPADLPNAKEHRPPAWPNLGTPATRSQRDELTYAMIRIAFAEFAKEVRRHDPHRIISTGNSIPRASAWHQEREKSWTKDTPEQYAQMLAGEAPAGIDVLSVHIYRENVQRLAQTASIAKALQKPLFVGEFGVPGPDTAESRQQFQEMLAEIEKAEVPLAALWVFDLAQQAKTYSVTAENERSYQLRAIAELNARWSAGR